MKSFKALTAVIILIIFVLSASGSAVSAANDNESDIYDRVESYLSETFPKTHFPSMSITVVDKDKVLLSKSYGDCESSDTPYLLGSVSKSFTALCIMQLEEQGKIDLNASLSEYLPNAADGDKITIIELLNHTSGLGEYQNAGNYKIVDEQGVHNYANVNYTLLGKVIEAVSGKTYEEYVTENVFEPLNMSRTYANPEKAAANELIQGYENWFGFNVKAQPKYSDSNNSWITVPAGYISSSTNDLGRYLQMYLNGGEGIVSSESINEMFYNGVSVDAAIPYKYGMGWTLINEPLSQPVLRHAGLVETGMSSIFILPESGIGIAVAMNANDYLVGQDFADRIGWGVALILMDNEPNQIGGNEYTSKHLIYNGIYFLIITIAILPLCFLSKYKRNLEKGRLSLKVIPLIIIHFLLPAFLLILAPVFFNTPLWVVQAFVPDLFTVIIISAILLFGGGIIKIRLYQKNL